MVDHIGNPADFKGIDHDGTINSDGHWHKRQHREDIFDDLIAHSIDYSVSGFEFFDDPTATIDCHISLVVYKVTMNIVNPYII